MRGLCRPFYKKHPGYRPHGGRHATGDFPAGTFAPGTLPKAYGFLANLGSPKFPVKMGILSLGGNALMASIQAYCQALGCPVPNFKAISVDGSPITSDPNGANVENYSDIDMSIEPWAHAYPNEQADILMAVGPNNDTGMQDTLQALREAGCGTISGSWGAPYISYSSSSISAIRAQANACLAAGIPIGFASGDGAADDGTGMPVTDCPSCLPEIWAVGGTSLKVGANGLRLSESAWGDGNANDSGGGGGLNQAFPTPTYQIGVLPGGKGAKNGRGVPDSSLNADPNTGMQICSDSSWLTIGGTSLSTPMTMGYMAVLKSQGASFTQFQSALYGARTSAFYDITIGSDGNPTLPGYDFATGLGSINGQGFAAALLGQAPPSQPPVHNPPTQNPTQPTPVQNPAPGWRIVEFETVLELRIMGVSRATIQRALPTIIADAQKGLSVQQILTDLGA